MSTFREILGGNSVRSDDPTDLTLKTSHYTAWVYFMNVTEVRNARNTAKNLAGVQVTGNH
jgi:hypothetical protein